MPMKISNINNASAAATPNRPADAAAQGPNRAMMFERTLSGLGSEAQSARMASLVADIEGQGQKLSKKADVRELERYRALIRQFMDEIVSNGFAFSKESAMGQRGSHRLMATVNVVNQRLEALAKEVLATEADNIKIIAMVDDIRGLLMDLFL